jgi:ABC-type Fe3+/spermidine/putrescine transport system ATPase subunit
MKNIKLSIRDLEQSYGEEKILKKISLDVFEGETLVVLGPSGCGKTSLLKSIAGLVPLDSGQLCLDGSYVENLPPQSRKAAMIFQNYALFPHMTVRENLEYGLTVKGRRKAGGKETLSSILALLRLEGLENRPVTELSGGQQQRVAIGRAMVIEPSVLLFDEPLSNLDENLRRQMRQEIRTILRKANVTSLYVTHDQNEALAMADRVVVMKDGEIEQIAVPEELHYKPHSEYVARFLGYGNIYPAEVQNDHLILWNKKYTYSGMEADGPVSVLIRPEDIEVVQEDKKEESLSGTILECEIQSSVIRYRLKTDRGEIDVSLLNRRGSTVYSDGDSLFFRINSKSFHLMRK